MTWEAKLKKGLEAIPLAKVRFGLTVLLSVLLVYLLAELTILLLPKEQSKGQWQPPKVTKAQPQKTQDIRLLQELALFGQFEQEQAVEAPKPEVAPKTKLNVKLAGISASRNPLKGSAVIIYQGSQATYSANDRISSTRAVVKEIYPDRVMISNGGRLEALVLDDYDGADYNQPTKPAQSISKPIKRKLNAKLSDTLKGIKAASGRERLAKITDFIRVSPVHSGGGLKGFRVNPGRNRDVFEATGLKPGDLAVSLNGYDLTDMSQTTAIMRELNTMESLSITVERAGQLYDFLFELPTE